MGYFLKYGLKCILCIFRQNKCVKLLVVERTPAEEALGGVLLSNCIKLFFSHSLWEVYLSMIGTPTNFLCFPSV